MVNPQRKQQKNKTKWLLVPKNGTVSDMNIKENAKKGIKTNIVGGVLIASGIVSVFVLKVSWTEAMIVIGAGLGFIGLGNK